MCLTKNDYHMNHWWLQSVDVARTSLFLYTFDVAILFMFTFQAVIHHYWFPCCFSLKLCTHYFAQRQMWNLLPVTDNMSLTIHRHVNCVGVLISSRFQVTASFHYTLKRGQDYEKCIQTSKALLYVENVWFIYLFHQVYKNKLSFWCHWAMWIHIIYSLLSLYLAKAFLSVHHWQVVKPPSKLFYSVQ